MIKGLTEEEVRKAKEEYGDNSLSELESEGFWDKLKDNFGDPMIKILCVALVVNVIFAILGQAEWYESVGIAIAVILATFVSTYSEYQNENAFQKLQEEASRIVCKAYRNNEVIEMSINDIVVGDWIILQTGDKVPADGILIDGTVKLDQSVLNGETKEALKMVMPSDYKDETQAMDFLNKYKLYRGSVVCSGNAILKVTTVGDRSVYGQIASELQIKDDRESPLKIKLAKLADNISKFGYIGGGAIAIAFLFQRIVIHNGFELSKIITYCSNWSVVINDIVHAVILAVIIIVMAVPEGLPLMIAIVSALNMSKMLKDNVLVRKIIGIETAGSLNLLFSDKTGTITKGKLETILFVDGNGNEYKSYDKIPQKLRDILSINMFKNTNAIASGEKPNRKIIGGNATERAILSFASDFNTDSDQKILKSVPFNSENKYSACSVSGYEDITFVKGAPEKIINNCEYYYDGDGEKVAFSEDKNKKVQDIITGLANKAIRVLAFATSENQIDEDMFDIDKCTIIGFVGIRDDVRPESITSIGEVMGAGVQVVMITGDRKDTAIAIARESGLLNDDVNDIVLTSDELAKMSDDEIKNKISHLRVVSRALPSDKSRLVGIAQSLNLVVGMTGDGVNDSPALKKADVGFAMGGGTEVAKEASDIVILDDNFSSIDKAILYGRTIFNTIRKFIIFQLTINVTAVLVSFITPLIGMNPPLSITQILWINLVMDTLAAIAFGGEPALERFMKEKPKHREENIVNKYMWSSIIVGGLWTFTLSLFILLSDFSKNIFRESIDGKYLLTGYFAFFIFVAVFNAFNARTEKINLFDNILKNSGFFKVIVLIIVVQVVMTYLGGPILSCYGLNLKEWIFILIMAFTIIPVDLLRKKLFN
ncbi:MAG: calcium-translocating P-type ATPase, PMCA-type [Fusobacteriaceae bacterium]|jgi:calcium-translocating P-type ATPase|nr:calcium-translocating P-type ATPase, PMCA-type [Fusobacteriaceae bacterium]